MLLHSLYSILLRSSFLYCRYTMLATPSNSWSRFGHELTQRTFMSVIVRLTKPSLSAPLQISNTQHLLSLQRPPTMMFPPMKRPLSSPRTDVRKNRPPPFRGIKSGFCSLSSSQNHSHPPFHTRGSSRLVPLRLFSYVPHSSVATLGLLMVMSPVWDTTLA